jgi:hypothetical protein
MSFTITYVDLEGPPKVVEHFICFQEVKDSSGEGLTEVILHTLASLDVNIADCRGQGYDNATNMRGKNKGVQRRILDVNGRAFFVPCGCHSLYLVVGDAVSCSVNSVSLLGVTQRIYVVFSASVYRWDILFRHLKGGFTVKLLCETRCECRIDCLKPLRFHTAEIRDALVDLEQDSKSDPALRHEGGTLIDSVSDFKNLVAMVVWYDVLFQMNAISKAMQSEQCCIVEAVKLMDSCSAFLDENRSLGFERAIVTATELANSLKVKRVFKETRKRKRNRLFDYEGEDEAVFLDPKEKLRFEFFLTTIDTVRNVCEE